MKNEYPQRHAKSGIGIAEKIRSDADMIVVIPAHSEMELSKPLQSLHACIPPSGNVVVLIIFNESEEAGPAVHQLNQMSMETARQLPTLYEQHVFHATLPAEKAGVGLARKIGMDEAVRYFQQHQKDGIIICYDADCLCAPNYLQAIEQFYEHSANKMGLVYYEHQTKLHPDAIIQYELFLRYYINALRISRYPFAVYTLGSCITVRSSAYQQAGGMNLRKTGEDFYFIHKFTEIGGIGEINATTIYPSDRISERIPHGTGQAVHKYMSKPGAAYNVYHPQTFENLKSIHTSWEQLYETGQIPADIPASIAHFYEQGGFKKDLKTLIAQSETPELFKIHFYRWWNGFRVLKYVHFVRDQFFKPIPLSEALIWLSQSLCIEQFPATRVDQLRVLRDLDRRASYYIK